jgi:hypothetical protein
VSRGRSDHPAIAITATAAGIVAVRDDQVIDLIDLHGVRAAADVAPGERIGAILARRGCARAAPGPMVSVDGSPAALRGARRRPARDRSDALAPDHRRIAAVQAETASTAIFDLATGQRTALPAFDYQPDESRMDPLGFVDDDTLALAGRQTDESFMFWLHAGELTAATVGTGKNPVSVGDRQVVWAEDQQLAISKPDATRFLGYEIGAGNIQPVKDG